MSSNYIYTGTDLISENELRHYKYLKKVRSPSGKYRYIYDESELKREQSAINAADKALRDKNGDIEYTNSKGQTVIKTKSGLTITSGSFGSKQSPKDKIKEVAVTNLEKKKKKHSSQKVKDIPKRLISRGIGAVNKILYNIEKSWIQ